MRGYGHASLQPNENILIEEAAAETLLVLQTREMELFEKESGITS